MKNFIFIILASFLFSCDDRDKIFEDINATPELFFDATNPNLVDGVLKDSLKTALKSGKSRFDFKINFSDENGNIDFVKVAIKSGQGILYHNGIQVANNQFIPTSLKEGVLNLQFEPTNGIIYHQLSFEIFDTFSKTAQVEMELTTFLNKEPVAIMDVSPLKVRSSLEYKLDASNSYDRDKRYGGELTMFRYQINDKVIITQEKSIPLIFPEEGNYLISLSVQDNDGEWSDIISEVHSIN